VRGVQAAGRGRAVQVDPIKPALKAPGTKRLKLIYDGPLSNFAFNFNLRRYNVGVEVFRERCGAGVMEAVERSLRDRAAQALPAGDAAEGEENGAGAENGGGTEVGSEGQGEGEGGDGGGGGGGGVGGAKKGGDADEVEVATLVKALVSAQRAAFAPALVAAVSAYSRASGHALERMAGAALEAAEVQLASLRSAHLLSGGSLDAKLGQVEVEAEAAMLEDMAGLGLAPDEGTGDCPIDSKGDSVLRCGEYLEAGHVKYPRVIQTVITFKPWCVEVTGIQ